MLGCFSNPPEIPVPITKPNTTYLHFEMVIPSLTFTGPSFFLGWKFSPIDLLGWNRRSNHHFAPFRDSMTHVSQTFVLWILRVEGILVLVTVHSGKLRPDTLNIPKQIISMDGNGETPILNAKIWSHLTEITILKWDVLGTRYEPKPKSCFQMSRQFQHSLTFLGRQMGGVTVGNEICVYGNTVYYTCWYTCNHRYNF